MLRDYQTDCFNAFKNQSIESGKDLYVLPTGSGKSHIIAAICEELKDEDILVLTPRRELVIQNKEKINNSDIKCMTINLAYRRNITAKIVIIDEAHLVSQWGAMYSQIINCADKVIGFTATPYRLDTGNLIPTIFDSIIYETDRQTLVNKKYLTPRNHMSIPVKDIINVKNDDFNSLVKLSKQMCPHTYNSLEHFKNNCILDDRTLIFGCDLTHCNLIKSSWKTLTGEDAPVLSSKVNKKIRNECIDRFKRGEIKTLINCEILTTGFDYPALNNIVILRPTDSYSLYEQILGRGDRIAEGKKESYIFDYTINKFNFEGMSKGQKQPIRHCMYCLEETDYRAKRCAHCDKVLIKGDSPTKKCDNCKSANYARASYCTECGNFIRRNVKMFECDKMKRRAEGILCTGGNKSLYLPMKTRRGAQEATDLMCKTYTFPIIIFYKLSFKLGKPQLVKVIEKSA